MAEDIVNKPKHYPPIEAQLMMILGPYPYDMGNAMKYWYRSGRKGNEEQDLRKALKYISQVEQIYKCFYKKYDELFVSAKMYLADTPEFSFVGRCDTFDEMLVGLKVKILDRMKTLIS